MSRRIKKLYKGFTMIELSVVLVIVGLLIGGLLVAQNMINSSKIQAFTQQIMQADSAVSNFKTVYGALPGDSAKKYAVAAGNENGIIGYSSSSAYAMVYTSNYIHEHTTFWPTLSKTGFKADENPVTGYVTSTPAVKNDFPWGAPNAPKAKIGKEAGLFVIGEISPPVFSTSGITGPVNMYFLADCSSASYGFYNCINGVSGADSIAADTKMDDGVGSTGNIVGVNLSASSGVGVSSYLSAWVTGGGETAYSKSSNLSISNGDVLIIRMGAQNGDTRE